MENKRVTHTARMFIRLWNVLWFSYIWVTFYNRHAFDTYRTLGAIVSIVIYWILYTLLCNVYKAFRIASTSIWEIIFSQFMAFASSDLILYVECCLIYNQIVNIAPGAIIVVLQLAGTSVMVITAKRYFMTHVPPQKSMVIYGEDIDKEDAENFEKRLLMKYQHLFNFLYTVREDEADEILLQRMQGCSTVIMYGTSFKSREKVNEYCLDFKKNFYYTPELGDVFSLGCEPKHLLDTPLMKYEYVYNNPRKRMMKRALDIIVSLLFLTLFSPLFLVVALCIKLEDHGPVFFKQKRYTQDGKIFEILKFRSMIVDAEKNGVQPSVDGDPRITKTGKWIRKTRIDELPQIINILKGDMSFVGPRPERVEHVDMYIKQIPEFRYRMAVKGGLTGYAQVFGKYNTSAYDKLLLDLMYIENQSLLLDFKIMLLTIRTVFQPESTEGFAVEESEEINQILKRREKEK